MRFMSFALAVLIAATAQIALMTVDVEAAWKPGEPRFKGCPAGKTLNAKGACR